MAADALSILETPTIVRKAAARRPAGTPEDRLEGVGTPHSILKVGVAYQRIGSGLAEEKKPDPYPHQCCTSPERSGYLYLTS